MEDQLFIFDPGTHTCKSPIPTRFEHLLGSVDKIEQYLTIHSQEDIVNINKLLEQTLNLQISNIISRVIAQVIGEHGDGFITIKGTEDGELHVYTPGIGAVADDIVDAGATGSLSAKLRRATQGLEDLKTMIVLAAGSQVQIEGTSRTIEQEVIDKASADNSEVITAVGGKKLCLVNIAFTVSAAADIYLNSNANHMTGEMDFGNTNEPRGFVTNNGDFPLKTVSGEGFFIESTTAARIRGFVTYYEE